MSSVLVKALALVALPIVVFVVGARIMTALSERGAVVQRLRTHAAPEDRRPLNQRLRYDRDAVARHWGALDPRTLAAERTFLELDLVFPLLYGAAFAISLLLAWAALGRPMNPAWLVALVGLTVVSDWSENLVQLQQLQRYVGGGVAELQSGWVAVASAATAVKLIVFGLTAATLITLVVRMIVRAAR